MNITEAPVDARPFQCPLCMRFFYFDQDYIKHKCVAKRNKIKWV